jgi:hypothetical protein
MKSRVGGRKTEPAQENQTEKKRPPAYKRQRELYWTHVWLDREIYALVLAFIGWERHKKYSVKMAVRILLELGLQNYITKQLQMDVAANDRAQKEGQEPPEPSEFIRDMKRKRRKKDFPYP